MITYKAIFGVLRAFDGKKRIHINNPTEFYSKKDVADLAKHVLPYIKKALLVHQGYEMPMDKEENLIAELEQIVKESA